jgi:hypothetical protein
MIELNGIESNKAVEFNPLPGSEFYIFEKEGYNPKAGDEVILLIGDPSRRREDYGMPLRITEKTAPDENETTLQYGERLLVAQKIPEFI